MCLGLFFHGLFNEIIFGVKYSFFNFIFYVLLYYSTLIASKFICYDIRWFWLIGVMSSLNDVYRLFVLVLNKHYCLLNLSFIVIQWICYDSCLVVYLFDNIVVQYPFPVFIFGCITSLLCFPISHSSFLSLFYMIIFVWLYSIIWISLLLRLTNPSLFCCLRSCSNLRIDDIQPYIGSADQVECRILANSELELLLAEPSQERSIFWLSIPL